METENKQKLFTVISLNGSKTVMRMVQLTRSQFGKFFSKDVINYLLQPNILMFPLDGKIGKVSIVRITLDSTKYLAVELSGSAFTNRFSDGAFNVTTKIIGISTSVGTTNYVPETDQPVEMVVDEQPSLTITHAEPQSEKADTGLKTNRKPAKTKVIPFPSDRIFSYDYSLVIRLHPHHPANYFYLSNVG